MATEIPSWTGAVAIDVQEDIDNAKDGKVVIKTGPQEAAVIVQALEALARIRTLQETNQSGIGILAADAKNGWAISDEKLAYIKKYSQNLNLLKKITEGLDN